MGGVNLFVRKAGFTHEFGLVVAEKGTRTMAAISTKDTSASTKATPAGKAVSGSMPLDTTVVTLTPTLKQSAEALVVLELDLKDLRESGFRWKMLPLDRNGKCGLGIVLYHPDFPLGVSILPNGSLVATISGERAGAVATRKAGE